MTYSEAVVIDIVDIDDEPTIEAEVIGIDNSPHWYIVQRKLMCCLAISITVFIMVIFVYSLLNS